MQSPPDHAATLHQPAYSPLDALLAAPWPLLGTLQLALTLHNAVRFGRPGPSSPEPEAPPAEAPPPSTGPRALGAEPSGPPSPRVTIVVVARDEAPRIASCLAALLAQTTPHFEVVVLDDGSQDGTAEAARAAAGEDGRVRIVTLPEPEAGWNPKAWACARGFEEASSPWLLFLDVAVVLAPDSLAAALDLAEREAADLLSWWPRAGASHPLDAVLLPLRTALPLAFLPLLWLETPAAPGPSWVNGQCLLIARKAYERAGGHAAPTIRALPGADLALAKAVRAAGGRVLARDAGPGTVTAGTESPKALLEALRLDLYPMLGCDDRQLGIVAAVLVVMDVLPPLAVLLGFLLNSPGLMSAGLFQTLQPVVGRLFLAWRLGQPLWSPLLHPLAVTAVIGLAVASRMAWRKGGILWKGRVWTLQGVTAAPPAAAG